MNAAPLVLLVMCVATTMGASKLPTGGALCSTVLDCGGPDHAICLNNTCMCFSKYTDKDCTYARKSKLTTFLLGFFVGYTGADMFYIGQTGRAVGKLLLFVGEIFVAPLILCILMIALACCSIDSGIGKITFGALEACFFLASCIWTLVDWAMVLANRIPDGHGESLWDNM